MKDVEKNEYPGDCNAKRYVRASLYEHVFTNPNFKDNEQRMLVMAGEGVSEAGVLKEALRRGVPAGNLYVVDWELGPLLEACRKLPKWRKINFRCEDLGKVLEDHDAGKPFSWVHVDTMGDFRTAGPLLQKAAKCVAVGGLLAWTSLKGRGLPDYHAEIRREAEVDEGTPLLVARRIYNEKVALRAMNAQLHGDGQFVVAGRWEYTGANKSPMAVLLFERIAEGRSVGRPRKIKHTEPNEIIVRKDEVEKLAGWVQSHGWMTNEELLNWLNLSPSELRALQTWQAPVKVAPKQSSQLKLWNEILRRNAVNRQQAEVA
jgi:hypothetical protein